MVKRSISSKITDERTFAVRVRFAIPELGLSRLDELHGWLQQSTGRDYAIHPANWKDGTDLQQCAFLHVNDLALALECVQRFDLRVHTISKQLP
jgi:hypothetical protein